MEYTRNKEIFLAEEYQPDLLNPGTKKMHITIQLKHLPSSCKHKDDVSSFNVIYITGSKAFDLVKASISETECTCLLPSPECQHRIDSKLPFSADPNTKCNEENLAVSPCITKR